VTSASIIVPGPWLTEVAAYAKAHPDADLGLHLALTSEWKTYRWGSVESKDKVPSLSDPSGYLWPETLPAVRNLKPEEAEREIRAQVERAIGLGIHPTHLDSHMGVLFSTPELFAMYVKVAHEYKLPFLAVRIPDAPCATAKCAFRKRCGPGFACHCQRQSARERVARFLCQRGEKISNLALPK